MTTKRAWVAVLAGLTAGAGGCSHFDNTEKGVGLGALAGAGLGTGIGALTGNPKTGAVVGTLLGAGAGGAIGNSMDREDREKREVRQASVAVAQAQQQRMGTTDVIQMVQAGHDEQVIINQIRNTGSSFQLSPADLDFLKQNNVPSRVIVEMQNARPTAVYPGRPRTVVVREEPTVIYREPPVIMYGPPPPVYVGGGYYRRW